MDINFNPRIDKNFTINQIFILNPYDSEGNLITEYSDGKGFYMKNPEGLLQLFDMKVLYALLGLSQQREYTTDIKITATSLLHYATSSKGGSNYKMLEKTLTRLKQTYIKFDNTFFLNEIDWSSKERKRRRIKEEFGILENTTFDGEVKLFKGELLISLNKKFVEYIKKSGIYFHMNMEFIRNVTSPLAFAIYSLLKNNLYRGNASFNIRSDDMIKLLHYKDQRKSVFIKNTHNAMDEINTKSDIEIKMDVIDKNHYYSQLDFELLNMNGEIINTEKYVNMLVQFLPKNLADNPGMSKLLSTYLNKNGLDYVRGTVLYCKSLNARTFTFYRRALEEDWGEYEREGLLFLENKKIESEMALKEKEIKSKEARIKKEKEKIELIKLYTELSENEKVQIENDIKNSISPDTMKIFNSLGDGDPYSSYFFSQWYEGELLEKLSEKYHQYTIDQEDD